MTGVSKTPTARPASTGRGRSIIRGIHGVYISETLVGWSKLRQSQFWGPTWNQ
jgi:hypothetical protein